MSGAVATFRRLVLALDYPMVIVTAVASGVRAGCLVGFSTQVSVDPPRYLVCVSDKNRTHDVVMQAEHVAVHVLTPADLPLAELFGTESGHDVDKFAECRHREGPYGTTVLDGTSWFVGSVLERSRAGDHLGVLLEPVAAHEEGERGQLGFQAVKHLEPGREP